MTYNQVLKRIKETALAHRQIRNFYRGLVTDFLSDKTTLYPSAFIQDNGNGNISFGKHETTFPFRLFLLDLVHLSENTNGNEQDIMSDMSLIAIDLIAQFSSPEYTDWRISNDVPTQFLLEDENDLIAGIMIDFSIKVPFTADRCQIPTIGMPVLIDQESKIVNDMEYIAMGNEGTTLSIPALVGKKILLLVRESFTQYEVSNNPNSSEFIWDGTIITLGLATNLNERFLILYRNY